MAFVFGSNNSTGCARPLTGNVPQDTKSNASPHSSMVSRDTRMRRFASLVSPSMRLARFTVSPIAVYSRRFSEPIRPTTAGPECRPMPTSKSECSRAQLALEGLQRVGHVERAGHRVPARGRASSSGAPHIAMMQSPMNLSSEPPWLNTTSTCSEK